MTAVDRATTGLRTATEPAPLLDPIALFAAAREQDTEAALWLQPRAGFGLVGVGRAWSVEPVGPTRFAEVAAAWRALLVAGGRGRPVDVRGAGPVLLGGLGFSGRRPAADDPWAAFGAASMVLPELAYARTATNAWWTLARADAATAGLDDRARVRLRDVLADRAAALAPARGAVIARPVEAALTTVGERPDRAAWDRLVGLFAGAVGRGRLDKVVLARRVVVRAPIDLDVENALRRLAATAPESTIYAFVRDGATFLGATPERLVRTSGRDFETVAIAGSAARGATRDDDSAQARALLADDKEREEHAVVVEMLRASLAPLATRLEIPAVPGVLPLATVQHLVTPIRGTLREDAGLLAIGERLHPTPAVAGQPRDLALEMIAEHERFERGWYAGPVGWLGADGDGELMVALRCGIVAGQSATLFAGCGIMADSIPAREWDESRLKLRTVASALGRATEEVVG